MKFADLPATPGTEIDGGIYAGIHTLPDGTHHAVLLLQDTPSKRLDWPAAAAWAESVRGQLPSRPIAALLFANVRTCFEPAWHWTNEVHEDDSSCAWYQGFGDGYQDLSHQGYEGRARAVRLIPLAA